jgi:hypothetical protein
MTLPRLYALNKYWEMHPSSHILVAAYMGYKPREQSDGNIGNIIAEFSAAGFDVKQ